MFPYQTAMVNPLQPYIDRLQSQQPVQVQKVKGIESARQYRLPPNSNAALFDTDIDRFYFVESDASGTTSVTAWDFSKAEDYSEPCTEYVTREEFDELKGRLDELSIQQAKPAASHVQKRQNSARAGRGDAGNGPSDKG